MTTADIVVAGAGCAGLSLAVHLLEAGVRDRKIVLIEPRTAYEADRTWSFWHMGSHPFEGCVGRQWRRWRLRGDGRSVVRGSDRHPYRQIEAGRFYRHALARLGRAENVELRLGTHVVGLRDRGSAVEVETDGGALVAALVFDSRPPRRPAGGGELCQHFLGQDVVMPAPVFDPAVATLMDFAPASAAGIQFTYLLPTAPNRALVESTWISVEPLEPVAYRRQIRTYLRRRFGAEPARVEREERGVLPMSRRPWPRPESPRVHHIGTAAGAIRPSTGYGFLAIQRSCASLARQVARQRSPSPARPYRSRARLLDQIFLTFLRRSPERAPALFLDLFQRAPAASLVRFLSDRGSWLDDLRVVRAMPGADMTATAMRLARPTWARP